MKITFLPGWTFKCWLFRELSLWQKYVLLFDPNINDVLNLTFIPEHTSYIGEDEAGGPVIVILEDKESETGVETKFATRKVLIINQKVNFAPWESRFPVKYPNSYIWSECLFVSQETSRLLLPIVAKIQNKDLLKQLRPDLATADLHKCRYSYLHSFLCALHIMS